MFLFFIQLLFCDHHIKENVIIVPFRNGWSFADVCKHYGGACKPVMVTTENMQYLIGKMKERGIETAGVGGWNGLETPMVLRTTNVLNSYDAVTNPTCHIICSSGPCSSSYANECHVVPQPCYPQPAPHPCYPQPVPQPCYPQPAPHPCYPQPCNPEHKKMSYPLFPYQPCYPFEDEWYPEHDNRQPKKQNSSICDIFFKSCCKKTLSKHLSNSNTCECITPLILLGLVLEKICACDNLTGSLTNNNAITKIIAALNSLNQAIILDGSITKSTGGGSASSEVKKSESCVVGDIINKVLDNKL